MASDDAAANKTPGEIVAERLSMVAHNHFPASNGVAKVTRLTAGATQEIWRFDLVQDGGDKPLILRRTPGGAIVERSATSTSIGLETEAEILRLAAAQGASGPRPFATC